MDENTLAKYPGLYQRQGVWYVRRKVPIDLRHLFTSDQRRKSLGTGDRKSAFRLYAPTLTEIEREFELKRAELGRKDNITQALLTAKLERLTEIEIDGLVLGWWVGRAACRQPVVDDFELAETLLEIEADLHAIIAPGPEEGDPATQVADQLLVEAGMVSHTRGVGPFTTLARFPAVDRSSEQFRYLCDRVRIALEIEVKLARDHLTGARTAPADPQLNPANGTPSRPSGASMRMNLGQLLAAYRKERVKVHGEESTARKYGLLFKVLEEALGSSFLVAELKREQCVDVMSFLQALPPNATKRFPRLTLKAAKEKAERDGLPGLAQKTIGSYMQNLAAILHWAENSGWGITSHTKGLVRTGEAKTERRGFTTKEIRIISPTFILQLGAIQGRQLATNLRSSLATLLTALLTDQHVIHSGGNGFAVCAGGWVR